MRTRTLLAAAAVAVAGPLLPASPAHAATTEPLHASITCDSTTNRITTSVSGSSFALVAGRAYTFRFVVADGSFVTPTTSGSIPQKGTTGATVAARVASDHSVSVSGYTRSWPAGDYLFYGETLQVAVLTGGGTLVTTLRATCSQDLRTTVTATCDKATHTVTVAASGVRFDGHFSVAVKYFITVTLQQTPDSTPFSGTALGPWAVHAPRVSADGTWSDVGYTEDFSSGDPYFFSVQVTVEVWPTSSLFPTVLNGRVDGSCVYAASTA